MIWKYLTIELFYSRIEKRCNPFDQGTKVRMGTKYHLIDPATGEILDAVQLNRIVLPKSEIFYMGYQNIEFWLYKDRTLTKGELIVYGFFKAVLDYKNEISYNQTALAKELDMHTPDVNKAINSLIKRGIIEKVMHSGNYFTYRMRDEYAKKGNSLTLVK